MIAIVIVIVMATALPPPSTHQTMKTNQPQHHATTSVPTAQSPLSTQPSAMPAKKPSDNAN